MLGKSISRVEVTHISQHGFWLLVGGREYLLPYEKYPWFKDARVSEILTVKLLHGHHLYWPKLDVDLELASLKSPDRWPLVARGGK
jgi:hypothetical protein